MTEKTAHHNDAEEDADQEARGLAFMEAAGLLINTSGMTAATAVSALMTVIEKVMDHTSCAQCRGTTALLLRELADQIEPTNPTRH